MANRYFELPGLSYELGGKIRSLPISEQAARMIMAAAYATDPNLKVVVSSGGQSGDHRRDNKDKPGGWTGSHRHDVDESGYSQTADVILMQDGKRVTPGSNKQLYADFLRNAAAVGFTGIGHYSWGVHVGGGSQAAWGPSKSSRDLDPFFGDAIAEGRQQAQQGVGRTLLANYSAGVPTPKGMVPGPPSPATMSPRLADSRVPTQPAPRLGSRMPAVTAPPTTALGYAPNAGTSTLGQPSVPLYREGWPDVLDMSTARPSLSAMTGAQNVARAATDAYRSVQGKPSTSRPTADQIYGGVIPAGGLDPAQLYSAAPGKQDRLRPQAPATPYDPYAGIIPAGGLNPAYVYAAAPGKTNRLRPPPSAPAQVIQASTGPVFGTVDGDITGTIRQVQLPKPVTQAASTVPPSGFIQGVDPTIKPNFIPVPQGGRPNVPAIPGLPWLSPDTAIPAMQGSGSVADAARNAWQSAVPPQRPAVPPMQQPATPQAPIPMPYPSFRTGGDWLTNMGTGLGKMQQQVSAMLPQPSTQPTWFEQQTGNPGSRGPNVLQLLGMMMNQGRMNSMQEQGRRARQPYEAVARTVPGLGLLAPPPEQNPYSSSPGPGSNTGSTPGQYRSSNDWFNSVTDPFYRG